MDMRYLFFKYIRKFLLSSSHETESVLFSGQEKKCRPHFLREESSFTIFWVQYGCSIICQMCVPSTTLVEIMELCTETQNHSKVVLLFFSLQNLSFMG